MAVWVERTNARRSKAVMRNGGPWRQKDIDDIKALPALAAKADRRP